MGKMDPPHSFMHRGWYAAMSMKSPKAATSRAATAPSTQRLTIQGWRAAILQKWILDQ
ncbi:hypothetical protein [Rhizobium mongolense]